MGRLYGFIIISLAPTIAAKMPRYALCIEKLLYRNSTNAKYGESENMPTERLPHGGAGTGGV